MIPSRSRFTRRIAFVAIVAASFLLAGPAQAQPKPGGQDKLIAELVCGYLQKGHLNNPEINDEISRRLFSRFIKSLDPSKLYFLKSDIEEFKKQETDLDDQLLRGDTQFPFTVYARFLTRLEERQKLIEELVAAKHDFNANESISTDYDKQDFAATPEELRERWRKRIKFDLLVQRIGEKPLPEAEAKQKVLDRYKGLLRRAKQLDHEDLLEMYLTALTTSIDPHSTYMSPATLDDFQIAMRLNFEGIGAVLRPDNGQTVIVEIMPGGAADKDGRLKPDDKIIGVADGDNEFVDVEDMKLRDVVKLIRGPAGSKVRLKVLPVGKLEPVVYALTRQKIEVKSQEARGEIIEDGKKPDGTPYRLGVIDLPSFYADPGNENGGGKSCTEDVRKLLKEFEAKKVDAVALDLRRNGGGSLGEALSLTGLFIDEGPVVIVKSPRGKQQLDDPEKGVVYGGPLVVLVSRYSASASEILAGALQDYGRALIVGDQGTHGKGSVQRVIDLGGSSQMKLGALKLTVQQFYRPNGDSTQAVGVVPDLMMPSLSEHAATNEKDIDFSLPFDKVQAVKHANLNLTPPELKAKIKELSEKRIKESKEFAKFEKEIEQFKERKARKSIPLNEKDLKEQFNREEAENIDKKQDGPEEKPDSTTYKFKRNFINNEILKIMEDFVVEGKKIGQPGK